METLQKDEPGWNSPWGRGRPGWHLECSVMSEKYLGKNFDIHGGGLDLIFPHHENEIAQSCCNNNTKKFANYWIHNGFVTINKEKNVKIFRKYNYYFRCCRKIFRSSCKASFNKCTL